MNVNDLHYQIPGALVLMNGVYSMDGNLFEFKGHVRTDATASQMVTGWKSWLLKPVDPFLKKNGAGLCNCRSRSAERRAMCTLAWRCMARRKRAIKRWPRT